MATGWSNASPTGAVSNTNTGTRTPIVGGGIVSSGSSPSYSSPSTTSVTGDGVTSKQTQTNMDAGSLAALQTLISQLVGGGTEELKASKAERQAEIGTVRAQRGDYSKEAAFADAQGAIAQQMRIALEKSLPALTRAAEGAGTSQGSMRALLLQDAQTRAAEAASAQGLAAAGQYGTISANLSNILESLTRPNDPVTSALIQALGLARGATTTSTTTGTAAGGNVISGGGVSSGGGSYRPSSVSGGGGIVNSGYGDASTFSPTGMGFGEEPVFIQPLQSAQTFDPNSLSTDAWNNLMKSTGASSGGDLYDIMNAGSWNDRVTF